MVTFIIHDLIKLTRKNNSYRQVLQTTKKQQIVLMCLKPLDDIKLEIHKDHDQFITIVYGEGCAIINNKKYHFSKNSSFIIPAGSKHKIINTSDKNKLKLYTIYSPPEHDKNRIDINNPDK